MNFGGRTKMAVKKEKGQYPLKFTLICILVFAVISSIIIGVTVSRDTSSVDIENDVKIIISEGWGINKSAQRLKEEGIIKYPGVFEFMAKAMGIENAVQPGWLEIKKGMSYKEILLQIIKANRDSVKVTIPEGYEIRQIAETLEAAKLIDKEAFYDELKPELYDYEFLQGIPKRENPLEGYLFPSTYNFLPSMTEREIINEMLAAFDAQFTGEFYARAQAIGKTVDEIVTLASIIEREARSDEDRGLISGVFHNRLKQGMRLQSCATVQYILKERKENLSTKDTQIKSPYNTYINDGLPIGPIASPGTECIRAALYPETTDALYFVLGADGKHIFSQTHEEHVQAKQSGEE